MCGIAGFFQNNNNLVSQAELKKMTDTLERRGPDASGVFYAEKCGLGHRRLSIIDLSSRANQPMESDDGVWKLVFNGEIYNFKEIRSSLEEKGVVFFSESDTEVVLKAFIAYGKSCLEMFKGFFAFAIYNTQNEELFIARDRIGIKPLYYYHKDGNFSFASELKAIVEYPYFIKNLNTNSIREFVNFQYIVGHESIYSDVKKLPPGNWLKIDSTGLIIESYWELTYSDSFNQLSFTENLDNSLNLLKESVSKRMIADVPLGAFLSGGNDSSLIVALMKEARTEVNTYTIGFDVQEVNEAPVAKKISRIFGTNHHERIVTSNDAKNVVEILPDIFDEPFADSSAIPTFLVSQFASKDLKVVLSGDGGDELFWGYNRYFIALKFQKLLQLVPKVLSTSVLKVFSILPFHKHQRFFEYLLLCIKNNDWRYFALWSFTNFRESTLNSLFENKRSSIQSFLHRNNSKTQNSVSILPIQDLKVYLPEDILVKVDRSSMYNGLEARVPFLDHKLIEHCFSIPPEQRYNGGFGKVMVKKMLSKYLPDEIIYAKKRGFEIPLRNWLLGDLNYLIKENLNYEYLKKQGIFNPNEVRNQLAVFEKGKVNNNWGIWNLIMFQLWFKKWVD